MQIILDNIHLLAGVACVFSYDPKFGITAHKSKQEFSGEALSSVGQILAKCFSWGAELLPDIEKIDLQYDQFNISFLPATGNDYLVVIHDPSLDADLLDTTLTRVLGRPAAGPAVPTADGGGMLASATAFAAGVQPAGAPPSAMLESEPVAGILAGIENALNKIMGPMASIVYNETRDEWLSRIGQLDGSALAELVRMLCAEIGDPGKIETFKSLIKSNQRR